ncbi:MAG: CPBP family intramembrane metalloprotease [Bacillota bacterium]|nr:CPBP family intramembrane metalloprotease [Bacillota bacterium]
MPQVRLACYLRSALYVVYAFLLGVLLAGLLEVLAAMLPNAALTMVSLWATLLLSSWYVFRRRRIVPKYQWRLALKQLVADWRIVVALALLNGLLLLCLAGIDRQALLPRRNFLADYLFGKVPAAFVEEVFFRAAVHGIFASAVPASLAVILTSVAFSMAHIGTLRWGSAILCRLSMVVLAYVFICSCVITDRYRRNGNLAYVTLLHCWQPLERRLLCDLLMMFGV